MKLVTTNDGRFITDASDKTLREAARRHCAERRRLGKPQSLDQYTWLELPFRPAMVVSNSKKG